MVCCEMPVLKGIDYSKINEAELSDEDGRLLPFKYPYFLTCLM